MFTIEYEPGGQNRRAKFKAVNFPPESNVESVQFAAPGTHGQTRVSYRVTGDPDWLATGWEDVDAEHDFVRQFLLTDLQPNSRYEVRVEARNDEGAGATLTGGFRTAPAAEQAERVVFTVSTGQAFPDRDGPHGYNIYAPMLDLDPSFFVHTGDIVYYDRLAKNAALARYHWQRTYSLPSNVAFHRQVGSYFIKDDHDAWVNDCWPTMNSPFMGELTFAQGLEIFREQVPMGDRTYRTLRWGKDLQIWLVEGRDFRSPNTMPDGPEKTIWGEDQMKWFQDTVKASDATFRILISPTPVVGPDRENKHDNHSNKDFTHEGSRLREFLAAQGNMVVVCGDRHWQYHSIDPQTGLREYSCGPASNKHAGGWSQDDFRKEYHQYLNVIGGFLSATVEQTDGKPTLTFRYHDDQGVVRYTSRLGSTADGKIQSL
jgi:alkaline phosphatase D